MFSGACIMKSRQKRIILPVSFSSQNIGPPYTVLTGCSRNKKEVTTPKLPPPPRSAQNRSGLVLSLAVTRLPSASTSSASRRLSIVNPYVRVMLPLPTAQCQPTHTRRGEDPAGSGLAEGMRGMVDIAPGAAGLTRTVLACGSTRMPFIGERSMTRPSSTRLIPAP